jgi:hypothetical protein
MSKHAGMWLEGRYLIPSLPATNVNDDVAIRKLGQGLRDNCLATTKSAWNRSGTALNTSTRP